MEVAVDVNVGLVVEQKVVLDVDPVLLLVVDELELVPTGVEVVEVEVGAVVVVVVPGKVVEEDDDAAVEVL